MDRETGEVVLLTGSSGFLGIHILRHLVEDNNTVEIRALDKVPVSKDKCAIIYEDKRDKIKRYLCDLTDVESCREAFRNVDVVLHCAALVSYDYPPNVDELQKNNVDATENVVQLCREEGVPRLVYCSSTEVILQSCFRGGIVAVSIYKSDLKLIPPDDESRLIFGEYAASKLRAERIILKANDTPLTRGNGLLHTTALRPTLLYGEGDPHLLPRILQLARNRGDNSLPRLSYIPGKQQITYVGNAAWAFIRAKETLRKKPEAIAGLPVSVTDDTLVEDLISFCERVTSSSNTSCVRLTGWPIPLPLSYFGGFLLQLAADCGIISTLQMPPCSLISYLGSIILFNRARASIHMDYWPKFTHEQTLDIASKYYSQQLKNII
ncbi:hypothetical protein QAD02_015660 [Eretmocerus hayati]|uniref:Uncharacterized protein n=1 Tax=Eretmocerus hayati TaxID=131215 RepID=A0ACC2P9V4_9HYME|nr:hypothetical protein QAD02_015660 [Eretmocerus hayati]